MAVCGPAGGAARQAVSRVCRRTSPEDGRTARVGHGGAVAGGYHSPLALGMTLGVRIVIYGARRRRGLRSTSTASVERKDISTCTETAIQGFWSERTTVGSMRRGWKGYGRWREKGAGRNPPKSPEADSIAERIRWTRVIHASPLVAPVLLADWLRLRACQRASSSFHVGTRTDGVSRPKRD
jgi:hypothetical protein